MPVRQIVDLQRSDIEKTLREEQTKWETRDTSLGEPWYLTDVANHHRFKGESPGEMCSD